MFWSDEDVDVRLVQPYQANKIYICPGCGREIPAGLGHLVAVPKEEPALRRHWHKSCWKNRENRPPLS